MLNKKYIKMVYKYLQILMFALYAELFFPTACY